MDSPLADGRPVAVGEAPPAPTPAQTSAAPRSTPGTWLPLVATCLGTFMLLVYATIVTVALPQMARDLHAGFGSLQWIIDVYTLALAGLLLGMAPSATTWDASACTSSG